MGAGDERRRSFKPCFFLKRIEIKIQTIFRNVFSRQAAAARHRTKLHRKVDRKASKGRKTRYTVQQELVNFMAPAGVREAEEGAAGTSRLLGGLFRPAA